MNPKKYLLLAVFLIGYLSFLLTSAPRVSTNEPWECIPAYQLWFKGQLNNPVLTGLEYMEEHFLGPQVIQPIISGFFYRTFGLSLLTGRLVTLLMALGTLWMFYRLLKFDNLSEFFIVSGLILLTTDNFFFYYARTIRAEIFVTFFAVLSFYYLYKAIVNDHAPTFMLAGLFAGWGAVTHPLFTLFLVALVVILFSEYKFSSFRNKNFWLYSLFVFLGLLPYFIYLFYQDWGNGLTHFWTQMKSHVTQSEEGYWSKFWLDELGRYAKYSLFPFRLPIVIPQIMVIVFSFRLKDRLSKFSRIIILTFIILLPFLITTRNPRYLLPVIPFLAVLVVKAIQHLELDSMKKFFSAFTAKSRDQKIYSVCFVLLMSLQILTNPIHMVVVHAEDYDDLLNTLRVRIPAQSKVVGPMTFWLGFSDCEYRTEETYESFDVAQRLRDFKPDYIITHEMYRWKNDKVKWAEIAGIIEAYAKANGTVIREIDNKTYLHIKIWKANSKSP